MTIAGIPFVEITGLLTLGGILFVIFRGVITKADCKDCKTGIDGNFNSGGKEFKELRQVQIDHGEQLAGIGSTVTGMAVNVEALVKHHLKGE